MVNHTPHHQVRNSAKLTSPDFSWSFQVRVASPASFLNPSEIKALSKPVASAAEKQRSYVSQGKSSMYVTMAVAFLKDQG